MKKSTLLV